MDPARKAALFEQNVIPHLNAAYNLARWLTRSSNDAEDLVQESYLRAFRSFDTFHGDDGRAWLLAVVRNTCFTWLRKNGGQPTVEFDEQMHAPADHTPDAESLLLTEASLGSLQNCLEALASRISGSHHPSRTRRIVLQGNLRYRSCPRRDCHVAPGPRP